MYMYVVRVIMEESLRITPYVHCKANVELNFYDLEQKRQHNLSYIPCSEFKFAIFRFRRVLRTPLELSWSLPEAPPIYVPAEAPGSSPVSLSSCTELAGSWMVGGPIKICNHLWWLQRNKSTGPHGFHRMWYTSVG